MGETMDQCLKMVAERRSEMMLDDIGHGDIESWIAKWEDRMATEAADVMTAAPHAGARSVSLPPPCFHF